MAPQSVAHHDGGDNRTTAQVLRQFERLESIKAKLIKQGVLNGNATPQQVIDTLRRMIPADVLA